MDQEQFDGLLCLCCLQWYANREQCECHPEGTLLANLDEASITEEHNDEDEEFRYAVCDGCGNYYGGTFYGITIWEEI